MSTQTQPAAPDDDEPTAIVADKATPLAELAWSDVEDDDDLFDTDDRSATFWLWLYVGTTAAAVLALGVLLWFVWSDHHHPTQAVAVPASSAPDVVPPSSPPPVAPAPPPEPTWGAPTSAPVQAAPQARDAAFIKAMQNLGITFDSQTRALGAAHEICNDLAQGYTKPNIVTALQNANSGFANADAFDFLSLSTAFYCPQYQ